MLVNIPFSQNVSVLAGILGAWPIAVSFAHIASESFATRWMNSPRWFTAWKGHGTILSLVSEPSEEILEADPSPETVAETTAE